MRAGRAIAAVAAKKRADLGGHTFDFEVERVKLELLEDLPAVQCLQRGEFAAITLKECAALFSRLSLDGGQLVKYNVVERVLYLCLDVSSVELDSVRQHVTVQLGGVITSQQFFAIFQVPSVVSLLVQAWRNKEVRKSSKITQDSMQVERTYLQHKVAWRVDRDDAFGTLPMNMLYMLVFMILVVYHLQIWRRQELERGIESWIVNQGREYYGPFIDTHVYSAATWEKWLHVSGIPGIFGECRQRPDGVEIRMGGTNVVVGDVFLRKADGEEYAEDSAWLLSSANATRHLKNNPNDPQRYRDAARISVRELFDPELGWVNDDTKEMSLIWHTYNNQAEMYAKTEIRIRLDRYGHVNPIIKARGVLIYAYPILAIAFVDVVYCLILLRTIWTESKDLVVACFHGLKTFRAYWTFWNFVDWSSVTLGFANIGIWICICLAMKADSVQSLLNDQKMQSNVIDLRGSELDRFHSDLNRIWALFITLHITVAVTAIFIVLKFFKAFQANPRLQTVTATLQYVYTDTYHFFVIFLAIFSSFAVIGHVLFGADITKFYTIGSSFNTGVTVLMGEFDWYAEWTDKPDTLPSGMPRAFLILWFICYTTFVLLVLLNMLLAIILEKHGEVADQLSRRTDARTLWQQMWRYATRKLETRGFIPLYRIRRMLERHNEPAHPGAVVTESSLMEAFPGMNIIQAKWIMNFLKSELAAEMPDDDDEEEARNKRIERFVQCITEELHVVYADVIDTTQRLCSLEKAFKTTGFLSAKARAGALESMMNEAASDQAVNESKGPSKAYKESLQITGLDVEEVQPGPATTTRWLNLQCTQTDEKVKCCF